MPLKAIGDHGSMLLADACVDVLQVVCGGEHSMAIAEGGKVYSWGRGSVGQTGHGNSETLSEPKLVWAIQHLTITQVCLPSLLNNT